VFAWAYYLLWRRGTKKLAAAMIALSHARIEIASPPAAAKMAEGCHGFDVGIVRFARKTEWYRYLD
jgi:hypothetical protein